MVGWWWAGGGLVGIVYSSKKHRADRVLWWSGGGTSGVDGSEESVGTRVARSRGEESGQWFSANTLRPFEGDA